MLWSLAIVLLHVFSLVATTAAFAAHPQSSCPSNQHHRLGRRPFAASSDNDDDGGGSSSSSSFDLSELQSRIENLQRVEAASTRTARGGNDSRGAGAVVELPVLAFDALLPRQRLRGATSDPTFARLLRALGIGGTFAMISLNHSQRKLRRDGVLCKIDAVDAPHSRLVAAPTAVDFSIVGLERCRVVGPSTGMEGRAGRWRRTYDPDGEESRLGWGTERFVDSAMQHDNDNDSAEEEPVETETRDKNRLKETEWSLSRVRVGDLKDNDASDSETLEIAERIPLLLDEWQTLASNERTYDNTSVVAAARIRTGQPGLFVDPAALLRNVRAALGPVPSSSNPTDLAFYGAALINPLPPLGCSPEIRGRILSATTARQRLEILEWAIQRSIRNLDGTQPL